jgi:hypothetical protein
VGGYARFGVLGRSDRGADGGRRLSHQPRPGGRQWEETAYYHEQSLKAKQAGDESAYAGINKLANEAYGKSFFLFLAMGMASIWPAFFAAAWLNLRFSELAFFLPKWLGGLELSFLAPFVLLYLAVRILFSKIKRAIPFLQPTPAAPLTGVENRR